MSKAGKQNMVERIQLLLNRCFYFWMVMAVNIAPPTGYRVVIKVTFIIV